LTSQFCLDSRSLEHEIPGRFGSDVAPLDRYGAILLKHNGRLTGLQSDFIRRGYQELFAGS
jgi:hypothetical protein